MREPSPARSRSPAPRREGIEAHVVQSPSRVFKVLKVSQLSSNMHTPEQLFTQPYGAAACVEPAQAQPLYDLLQQMREMWSTQAAQQG